MHNVVVAIGEVVVVVAIGDDDDDVAAVVVVVLTSYYNFLHRTTFLLPLAYHRFHNCRF